MAKNQPATHTHDDSFQFTPTSASWPNAVEGFVAKLTRKRLRRGSVRGIVDLQAAIHRVKGAQQDGQAFRLDRQS